MITAPFNFVPLSEKVFFPDWSEKVSHDVPFEDAQSGVIDITITAKSPLFVRDHDNGEQFCQHNGQYYIPGSSVKGMTRNILEIMSFSKMSMLDDNTYAVRDLRNRELYMSKMTPDKTMCGWLKKVEGHYVLEDCGKPGRIKHSEIDKIYSMDFASNFKLPKFKNKAKDKTAKIKYGMIDSNEFVHHFKFIKNDVNREIYAYDTNCTKEGTLVLTGQPSARKEPSGEKPSGKVYEFIFFESKSEFVLKKAVVDNFLFAYFDGRKTEPKESPDWEYWKEKLNNGEKVPVFFQKNGKDVLHFGLSYLYKLPYAHSIKDGIPPKHSDERKDLAQTMFGYTSKEEALKGRVQFSHFKAASNVQVLNERTAILGTPRASYYPMYVKQQDGKLFKTFMDGDFSISGWKRYPVHAGSKVEQTTDTGNENVGTTFSPLKEGVVFSGKVRYHNLKKAELGALLSSLSFHNTDKCFHNIGLAKALGYGKIELKLSGIDNIEEYLKSFEVELSEQVGEWSESEQIKELLTMATEQNNSGNSRLKYMDLPNFANSKSKDKDFLRSYTLLENINAVMPKSLISQEDLEELRKKQEERKEKELLKEEERKQELAHAKEWGIVYESSTLATIEAFVNKYPNSKYIKTANEKIAEIKEEIKKEKDELKNKEAKDKWDAVQKVESKYSQKALEDFIKNFGDSAFVKEAQVALDKLSNSKTTKGSSSVNLDDIVSASDGKKVKSILEQIDNPDKDELKRVVIELYKSLNKKKQKNFFKDAQLARYISVEFENEIKKEL